MRPTRARATDPCNAGQPHELRNTTHSQAHSAASTAEIAVHEAPNVSLRSAVPVCGQWRVLLMLVAGATACAGASPVSPQPAVTRPSGHLHPHPHPHPHDGAAGPAGHLVIEQAAVNPWTHLKLYNDPNNFQFAIVSDRTGSHRPGIFAKAMERVNSLRPEFVLSVGDLVEGYIDDEMEIGRQWNEVDANIRKLEMPFFYVAGNHDYSSEAMARVWRARLGRDYYHFVYRDVLFLALNTMHGGDGTLGIDQVAWAKQVLADAPHVRWTVVLMHHPLWVEPGTPQSHAQWDDLESALASRKYTVFAGHYHRYTRHERHGRGYYVLGTTGGGSPMRGHEFGELDHVAWITMTDLGPHIANVDIEGILAHDFFTATQLQYHDALRVGAGIQTTATNVRGRVRAEIAVSNRAAIPVSFSAHVHDSTQQAGTGVKVQVEAGATRVIPVELNVGASTTAGAPIGEKLEYEARFEPAGSDPVVIRERIAIGTERTRSIVRTRLPIRIDGNLGGCPVDQVRWPEPGPLLRERDVEGVWTGPEDLRFAMGLRYDADHLYVCLRVDDEAVVVPEGGNLVTQDGVALLIDGRADTTPIGTRFRDFLVVYLPPSRGDQAAAVYLKERLPEGTQVASGRTEGGYTVEAAIPTRYLDGRQGGAWKHVRLGLRLFDRDGSEPFTQIQWRPIWGELGDYPGSGMFLRAR